MTTESTAGDTAPASNSNQAAPLGESPSVDATQSAASPAGAGQPLSKADRLAAIRANFEAELASDGPGNAADDGSKTPEAKTEATPEAKPDRAVATVAKLSKENRDLRERLKAFESKPADADSIAALRARVKKDPYVLLDEFGEEIDADPGLRLTKLADSELNRKDPEFKAKSETDQRIEKLEKELAAERARVQDVNSHQRDTNATAHTAKVLSEGFKDEQTGESIVEPGAYPFCEHLTKIGEVDAPYGIMLAVRELANDLRKAKSREPTDREIGELIRLCAGKAEAHFKAQSDKYRLPEKEAPKTDTNSRPQERRPRTITNAMGSGHASAPTTKPNNRSERMAAIREDYLKESRSAA